MSDYHSPLNSTEHSPLQSGKWSKANTTTLRGSVAVALIALLLAAIALGVAVHNGGSSNAGSSNAAAPAPYTVRVPWPSSRASNGLQSGASFSSPPAVGSVVSLDDSGNLRSGAGLSLYLDNTRFDAAQSSIAHLLSTALWGGEVLLVASTGGMLFARITPGSSLADPVQWETIDVPAPSSNSGVLNPDGFVALSNTTFVLMQDGATLAGRYNPATGQVLLASNWTPSPSPYETFDPVLTGLSSHRFAMSYFCYPSGGYPDGPVSICGVTGALLQPDDAEPAVALNITLGPSVVWSATDHGNHAIQGLTHSSFVFVTDMDNFTDNVYAGVLSVCTATVDWSVPGGQLNVSSLVAVPGAGSLDSNFVVDALSEDVIVVAFPDSDADRRIRVSAIQLAPSNGQPGATLLASAILSPASEGIQYRYMSVSRIDDDAFALTYDDSAAGGSVALVVCALRDSDPLADETSSSRSKRWSTHGSFTLQRVSAVLEVSTPDVTGAVVWASISALDAQRFALVYSHCDAKGACSGRLVLADMANAPVGVVSALLPAGGADDASVELQLLGGAAALPSSATGGDSARVDGPSVYFSDSNGRIVRGPPLQRYRSGLSLRDGWGAAPSQFLQFRTADGWLLTAAVGVGITDSQILTEATASFA